MLRLLTAIFRLALTASGFIAFYAGGLVLCWVVLPPVWLFGGDHLQRVRRCQAIVHRGFVFFHAYARISGSLRFDPHLVNLHLPPGGCVVIANHPTLIDVTAVMACLDHVTCIVKGPLFHHPAMARLLRYCWHIDGGSADATSGASVMLQAADRLQQQMPVLIFPEGTRSPPRQLQPFRRGAFEIAMRSGVTIVPLLLTCDPPALAKGVPWYAYPSRTVQFGVKQLPTLDPAQWQGDSKRMCADVQAMFQAELDGAAT